MQAIYRVFDIFHRSVESIYLFNKQYEIPEGNVKESNTCQKLDSKWFLNQKFVVDFTGLFYVLQKWMVLFTYLYCFPNCSMLRTIQINRI